MAIANNPAKPSFQNTVLALEISGVDLKELQAFFNLTGSNTNPVLQALQAVCSDLLST
jgi:peptidyl-dipeptidase Dcp